MAFTYKLVKEDGAPVDPPTLKTFGGSVRGKWYQPSALVPEQAVNGTLKQPATKPNFG